MTKKEYNQQLTAIMQDAMNTGYENGILKAYMNILTQMDEMMDKELLNDTPYAYKQGYNQALIELQIFIRNGGIFNAS